MTATSTTAAESNGLSAGGSHRRADRGRVALLLMAALVLGVVAGLLWPWLAPRQTFLITVAGPFPVSEQSAGRVVSADAWFALMTSAAGVLLGVLAALSGNRRAPMVVLGAVGASLLQVVVVFVVGQLIANHRLVFVWAPVGGENLPERGLLVIQAWPVLAFGPLFAVVVTLVEVALSSPPAPAHGVEPGEPLLRAGTWQPRARARHARPPSDAGDDDPLRLAPEELPWGIPARAAGHDGGELPPATVLATRRTSSRALIVAAAGVVIVVVVLVLAFLL